MLTFKKFILAGAIVLITLLLLWLLANTAFHIVYFDFYKNSSSDFKIPGLNSGFIPQGIEETPRGILVSGYMKGKGASRIYITDGKTSTHVEIFEENGEPHTGHGGGIDFFGDNVFLTGNGRVNILSLADITDGDKKASIKGSFDPGLSPAWCTVNTGYILVGSFASEHIDSYPPKENEIFTTPSGDKNVALIKGFKLDESYPCGINPKPEFAISIGEKVQGLSFAQNGTIILSTSYGLSSSELIFHSAGKMFSSEEKYETEDGSIPLYYLDSSTETSRVKAPPMSEELMVKDGFIYIMNESASDKYIFGKFLGQYHIYKYKF